MLSPVEQIKAKLSIVDVVSSYVKLEKAGTNLKARCPFHNEKSASFFVSPGRETYHCFGCAKGGDIFSFVEEIEHVEFREALAILAERAGVDLGSRTPSGGRDPWGTTGKVRAIMQESVSFYENELGKNPKALEYLKDRGVTRESIKGFKIGYAPNEWSALTDYLKKKGYRENEIELAGLGVKGDRGVYDRFRGRIMFPFNDYSGRPIGFSGRILPGIGDEKMGKYVNSPETPLFHKSKVFFGLDAAKIAIREKDKAILVEGQLDLVMAHQAGTNNAVAVSGTAFTPEHASILRRLSENLLIILDSDEAGFRASERSVRTALSAGMYVRALSLPEGQDPADVIKSSPDKWHELLKREKPYTEYALDFIRSGARDSKEMHNMLVLYLYPHVSDMYNEIEKDKALQDISSILNVSQEASRKDFEKWQKSNASPPERAEVKSAEAPKSPILIMIARRLLGLAALYEGKDDPGKAEEIRKKVTEYVDPKTIDARDSAFEAEMYYTGHKDLEIEVAELIKRLEKETVKDRFATAMDNLRKAEQAGDTEMIQKYLKECQEISKNI